MATTALTQPSNAPISLARQYLPTAITLFPDLTIRRSFNGYWYWGRPTLEELRADMRAVTRTIRPDWEPPAP